MNKKSKKILYKYMCSKIITRRLYGGLAAHGHCCCCCYAVTLRVLSQASSNIFNDNIIFNDINSIIRTLPKYGSMVRKLLLKYQV